MLSSEGSDGSNSTQNGPIRRLELDSEGSDRTSSTRVEASPPLPSPASSTRVRRLELAEGWQGNPWGLQGWHDACIPGHIVPIWGTMCPIWLTLFGTCK